MCFLPVRFEIDVTVAPPWTTWKGTINKMRKVRPEMSVPLLPAIKLFPAVRAHRAGLGLIELNALVLGGPIRNVLSRDGDVDQSSISVHRVILYRH